MGKANQSATPGGVPKKASDGFVNRKGEPLPAGAVLRYKRNVQQQKAIPRVAPKRKPEPMPGVVPPPRDGLTTAPTSVPSKTGRGTHGLPPGAALGYEKDYQKWLKEHPKQAKKALEGWGMDA